MSRLIQGMEIVCRDYREFASERGSLLYLDPPYFIESGAHYYGGRLELEEFKEFLRGVSPANKVVLSEQHAPEFFGLVDGWEWRPVRMRRAANYSRGAGGGDGASETIAWNWRHD